MKSNNANESGTQDRVAESPAEAQKMFDVSEGRRQDGSIGLPKITMATIRALPGRCQQINNGEGGKLKIALFTGSATGIQQATKPDTGEVFFGLMGLFGAVRYDMDGEPDAIYKSTMLYLPINHQYALDIVERTGLLNFAFEFYAQPAKNPAGYSWSYVNLATLDRDNLSPIDRLIGLGVAAGRSLELAGNKGGLLADLRRDGGKTLLGGIKEVNRASAAE